MSFQYTLQGGPIDGKQYGPFPENVKDSPNVEKILKEDKPRLHVTYTKKDEKGLRNRIAGQYRIERDGDGFVGVHVPSDMDVYAPVEAPSES